MSKLVRFLSEYLGIVLGIFLSSVGLEAFLLPNGFLDGGVTGLAILINELFGINISLLLIVISVPFIILAWFTVAKRVVYKSIFSIVTLALLLHFENFPTITDDKLLTVIFGGLLLGVGIGLAIRNGAVLDGSEIIGLFINDRFGIKIGTVVLLFNIILFAITSFVLSLEVAMYSILTYIITAQSIDYVIKGFEDFVGVFIVSDQSTQLEEQLTKQMGSGLTVYNGQRGYGSRGVSKEINIIQMIINRIDIRKLYNTIKEIDEKAFIVEFDINNVQGGVLRKYLTRKK